MTYSIYSSVNGKLSKFIQSFLTKAWADKKCNQANKKVSEKLKNKINYKFIVIPNV